MDRGGETGTLGVVKWAWYINKVRMPLGHRPPAYEIKIMTKLSVWISKSRLNIEYLLTGTDK